MSAQQNWQAGTVASVEIAMHEGRGAAEALAVALVLDPADGDEGDTRTVFLTVPADAAWGPILTAAVWALYDLGCPPGLIRWAGQPERAVEACGCSWITRELALPTAGDTETHEGARR